MSAAYAEVLLDAHVHYHDGFSRRVFLDAAWRNLAAGERQLGLDGAAEKGLMFTESRGADVFGALAARAGSPPAASGEWSFRATDEDNSLWAVGPADEARILLIAGRQLVTHEGLEVLALGCRHPFADGLGLRQARDAVIERGGIPVIPWGFGKWWFSRGRLLADLLAAPSPGRWFVGDNAGRPRMSTRPALFARAAEHGVFVLPGSDPLPLAGQESKPGRCGFCLAGGPDERRPAESILATLRACERQPAMFGRYEGVAAFARDQIAMQMHKRRAGAAGGGVGEVKVLAVAPQPFFTPRGTPLSVYYRTLVTAEMGHQVDLLTYGQGVDADIPGVRIVRIPAFRWLGKVKVGPSLLKAFLDLWIFLYAVGMMIRNRYDVVHAHEEAVFFCRFLQPIFRYKLIYDLHSILSQQLTNFSFTRSKLLIGLFARLEDSCLAKADGVISISPALAAYAVPRVRHAESHFLIENSLFDPLRLKEAAPSGAEDPPWLSLLGSERPVILYAGTFESYQGIGMLLEAFAKALAEEPQAFLLLLGGAEPQVEAARRKAQQLGIDGDCCLAGQVSRDLAQRATREANVLTSPRTVGDNTPLKIYEQIASGVPLVATRIGSHTQVLSDTECTLVDAEPDSFAAGLVAALRGGEAIEQRVANARTLYDERYSPAAYRDKMRRLFDQVGA